MQGPHGRRQQYKGMRQVLMSLFHGLVQQLWAMLSFWHCILGTFAIFHTCHLVGTIFWAVASISAQVLFCFASIGFSVLTWHICAAGQHL